ncbi:MAG: MogA/MoaB family molybdenum cofactor biosynthesis protein [Verrucomicrobia bacterium]|nr:MogA/MoaB family molybdenum cofactor biosynthesis protein [Verrucomicrobiota bacterium]
MNAKCVFLMHSLAYGPRLGHEEVTRNMEIKTAIITVSDRASNGEYEDLGGPAVANAVRAKGWHVLSEVIVPDERLEIQKAIRKAMNQGSQLILTTGGTGIAPRDVTPEAILEMADKELPGFGETMRRESLKVTPNAILSRNMAATIGNNLVIALPGKPSGAVECLEFVHAAIPHTIKVLQGIPSTC